MIAPQAAIPPNGPSGKQAFGKQAPGKNESFLAQAGPGAGGSRATEAATHRRLLGEMKRETQALGFSLGELLSNLGRNFNLDGPLHPRQTLAVLMLSYEEALDRFEAGDQRVSLRDLTNLSTAVNDYLVSIQNGTAKRTARLSDFGAGVAEFVRSMSVGMAAGIANQIGGPPMGVLVGGLTSFSTLGAMTASASLQGIPIEQLNLPDALINDAGNLLTTIGSPQLLAFFNLPAAPTANTMRGIAMHMVRQGGADAALDAMFVAFAEATFKKQPIPDALRAGAVQGVFSFLTTAGIAGMVGRLDAVKSDNFGKMIAALDDSDANRLMSQFSPDQAEALRKANPIVYKALNGRTNGALDDLLNNNPRGAQAASRTPVELVEVSPGEYGRRGGDLDQASAGNLNRRPPLTNQASGSVPANAATPVQMSRLSEAGEGVVSVGRDELTVSEQGGNLIVTVPGGDSFRLPEGMKPDRVQGYLENVWLNGALPGHPPPREAFALGGRQFEIVGGGGVFALQSEGQLHRLSPGLRSVDEAIEGTRRLWLAGDIPGFPPPRQEIGLGNARFEIRGDSPETYVLARNRDLLLAFPGAGSSDEAAALARQQWMRGLVPGETPPVSRLTLDAENGVVAHIIGGGNGPFALGGPNGEFLAELRNKDGLSPTSLEEASRIVKQGFEGGRLAEYGYRAPVPATQSPPVPPSSSANIASPDWMSEKLEFQPVLPDPDNPLEIARWTGDTWPEEVTALPGSIRRRMNQTLDRALADKNLDPFQRETLENARNVLRGPQTHPDPTDVFGIVEWAGDNWADQLSELAPPAVRDEMLATLLKAERSNDPNLRYHRDDIRKAIDELRASGAQGYPNPGDITFGSGFAREVLPGDHGVRDDARYIGLNQAGKPVFELPDGKRVGPFYEAAGALASEARLPVVPDPTSALDRALKYFDVRVGLSLRVADPLTGDPMASGAAIAGLETVTEFRDARKPLAPGETARPMSEVMTTAFGISIRAGEFLSEPRIISRMVLSSIGLRGFGTNSALQFKGASLNAAAVTSLRGEPSGFVFKPAGENAVEVASDGGVRVTGNLNLNAREVPTQMDAFGNDEGRKFALNEDLTIDKTLKEMYLPRLDLPFGSTPSLEYREESASKFVIPADTILPEEFVQMVNRRVGNAEIAVTMPGNFAQDAAGTEAAAIEVANALAGRPSFIDDIPKDKFEAKLVGGYTQRVSSVPGNPFDPYEGSIRLDVNFRKEENVLNDAINLGRSLVGMEPRPMPFERAIRGTDDPVMAMRSNENGYNDKVRWKINLPFSLRFGNARAGTAAYALRQPQPDMRTALMTSSELADLTFGNQLGHPRHIAVPTWLATMVSVSQAPGQMEAQLGLAQFPAGGIVVPPGGEAVLRGFLTERFDAGTNAQRQAISTFLDMYMNGSKGQISDTKTLMPEARDELIQLLYMIADPVEDAV